MAEPLHLNPYREEDFPHFSPAVLADHFVCSSGEYFALFEKEEIAAHLDLLERGSPQAPIVVKWASQAAPEGLWVLDACGRDVFGSFTLLAGIFTKLGFDILKAFSFTHGTRARWFTSRFWVKPAHPQFESDLFQRELNRLAPPLYAGDLTASLKRLRVEIIESLPTRKSQGGPGRVAPISINAVPGEFLTELHISGHSESGFLFSLCNALALRNMAITQVRVHTRDGAADDVIGIVDRRGRPIVEPSKLDNLKAAVLLIKHFTGLLNMAPDINQSLDQFDAFLDRVFRDGMGTNMILGMDDSRFLAKLAAAFGSSEFIWEEFLKIQSDTLLSLMRKLDSFKHQKSLNIFTSELDNLLSDAGDFEEAIKILNTYKDRELLRIDLLYLIYPNKTFFQFSRELSELAEVVLNRAVHLIRRELGAQWGLPRLEKGPCRFSLLALGKLGGRELGYASDLELVLVYEGAGRSDGSTSVTNADWFAEMMQLLKKSVQAKKQGIFELDLRLRPHGEDGPWASSLPAWKKYYTEEGGSLPYERQALIRLRPIYGEAGFWQEILKTRDEIIWGGEPVDLHALVEHRGKQLKHLVKPGVINAKYSEGALCDLEYSVQYLQMLHGFVNTALRDSNTLKALDALLSQGVISPAEFEMLFRCLTFFRRLINSLRVVRGHAKDLEVPPEDSEEYGHLVRRMGYRGSKLHRAAALFAQDLQEAQADVKSFYHSKFIDSKIQNRAETSLSYLLTVDPPPSHEEIQRILKPDGYADPLAALDRMRRIVSISGNAGAMLSLLVTARRHIQKSPSPDSVLINLERYMHNPELSDIVLEQLIYNPSYLEIAVLIFGHGDFLASILINYPFLLHYVGGHSSLAREKSLHEYRSECREMLREVREGGHPYRDLHLWFNREIMRIAVRDIYHNITLGSVIREISTLAGAVVSEVFNHVFGKSESVGFTQKVCFIALGKLGGGELNYSSDIDLVLVNEDGLDPETQLRLETLCREVFKILSESTPGGRIFRIDTNLKPYGSQGAFMASESHYRKYFDEAAKGWELQAWIKARPVAGNYDLGLRITRAVQAAAVDPFRLEESIKNIRFVREHSLKQHSAEALYWEVKQSPGGIRSAEFFTQMLQLQNGKRFPDLISGHTMRALKKLQDHNLIEGEFCEEMIRAYVFFRRIEHALQLEGMQQKHEIPKKDREIIKLAKRMGFSDKVDAPVLRQFFEKYHSYAAFLMEQSGKIFPGSLAFVQVSQVFSRESSP